MHALESGVKIRTVTYWHGLLPDGIPHSLQSIRFGAASAGQHVHSQAPGQVGRR